MRTLQSSYRSQANLCQFSDFDTMKTNVKTILFSKEGCRAQYGLGVQVADLSLEPLSVEPRVVDREIDGREMTLDAMMWL